MAVQTAELIIIGAGPAGFSAALKAASLGAKTVLVEEHLSGGVCLHSGCIPMLANSTCKQSPEQIRALVATLQRSLEKKLAAAGVRLVKGKGKIIGESAVSTGKKNFVASKGVLIATGCKQILPEAKRFTSIAGFFSLNRWPKKIAISGAGVAGCEFASFLVRRGIHVSLYEKDEAILSDFCDVASANVKSGLERAGVQLHLGEECPSPSLCAFGRIPATDGLGLSELGVALTSSGAVKTDRNGRTSLPWLYAAGDVRANSPKLASTAMAEGVAIAEYLLAGRVLSPRVRLFPRHARTIPPVAETGDTSPAMQCVWFPFSQLGAAWALGSTAGGVAWFFSPENDAPSGAVAVGENAELLIAEATALLEAKLKFDRIAALPRIHPSLSEAWRECALLCTKETAP